MDFPITKDDLFAAAALQGLIASGQFKPQNYEEIGVVAWQLRAAICKADPVAAAEAAQSRATFAIFRQDQ